jgi:metallo-beta-lactamase family protein
VDLQFLGGATTVTGSQFLVVTDRARVLVDCGMFQGGPSEAVRNRVPFAFDPPSVDAVVLTHAHLDHCGLLPILVREGFRGEVIATAGTVELADLVLRDSGRLNEEFARREERWERRHPDEAVEDDRREEREYRDALTLSLAGDHEAALRAAPPELVPDLDAPLYTEDEAVAVAPLFRAAAYGLETEVAPGIHATLQDAGHILGSAIVRLRVVEGDRQRIIVFSGDLGRPGTPILRDPTVVSEADYVVVESTYGGVEHDPQDEAIRLLAAAVNGVAADRGVLLIPSFAIGRTQEIVWELDRLVEHGAIPALPLFLDSPMARAATDIYRGHPEYFDEETYRLFSSGATPLDYPAQTIVRTGDESVAVRRARRPYMVVASNGMLTGGRIVNHVRDLIDDPGAVILFVGYQGQGTLGRHLQDGARIVRIDGAERQVRCQVRTISGFSAHADESELLDWLRPFAGSARRPRTVFLVHGDPDAQAALEPRVRGLGLAPVIPRWRERVILS